MGLAFDLRFRETKFVADNLLQVPNNILQNIGDASLTLRG